MKIITKRERKTKKSYSIAKNNLVSSLTDVFSTWERQSKLSSLSICIHNMYINLFQVHFSLYCFRLLLFQNAKVITRRCAIKWVFLRILQNSQENTCATVSFLNKIPAWRSTTVLKDKLRHKCFFEFLSV